MIEGLLSNNDLVIGLTRDSINRLLTGDPVKVVLENDIETGRHIFIVFGENNEELYNNFKSAGLISGNTNIKNTDKNVKL